MLCSERSMFGAVKMTQCLHFSRKHVVPFKYMVPFKHVLGIVGFLFEGQFDVDHL